MFMRTFMLGMMLSSAALANAPNNIWQHGGGGAQDLLHVTKDPPAITGKAEKSAVKITQNCTDSAGKTHDSADPSYGGCMADYKAGKGDAKNAAGVGFKIGK